MTDLEKVLNKLTRKEVQVEIFCGLKDVINGYGWHNVYSFSIHRAVQFCSTCRRRHGYDYVLSHYWWDQHRHSWNTESVFVFQSKCFFHSFEDLVKGLAEFESSYEQKPHLQMTFYDEIASVNPHFEGNERLASYYLSLRFAYEASLKKPKKKSKLT